MKRHLPKALLDWTDRIDIWWKEKYNISPKQKAIELRMDTIGSKRIDQNIQDTLEHGPSIVSQFNKMKKDMADKQHRKHKEKRKKKKPK